MKSKINAVIFFIFLFMVMVMQPLLKSDSSGIELVGQWDETAVDKLFIKKVQVRGQVIYLPKMFRIDEKLEFKFDNNTPMTNNMSR